MVIFATNASTLLLLVWVLAYMCMYICMYTCTCIYACTWSHNYCKMLNADLIGYLINAIMNKQNYTCHSRLHHWHR